MVLRRFFSVMIPLASFSTATVERTPLSSRIRGAYFGALVGDALSLGTHYEYDAKKIKAFYGAIDRYYAPGEKTGGETHGVGWGARNFHGGNGRGPPKQAGEQTDYGDYNILVLEHLANTASNPHRIQLGEFIPTFQKRMETWRAWMCTMTKETLAQVAQGVPHHSLGGRSNAMAIRHAAAYAYYDSEEDIVHAARTAMFTHRETTALQGGEFFARVAFRVIHNNLTPRQAIEEVAQSSPKFIKDKVKQALDKVEEATDPTKALSQEEYVDDLALTSMARLWDVGKSEPIKVGKASPTEGTLPGSIYFIVKYQDDLMGALQSNAAVGGDNASRGVAIGMVLGAWEGVEAIPPSLGPLHLKEWTTSAKLLDTLPLLRATTSATTKVEL